MVRHEEWVNRRSFLGTEETCEKGMTIQFYDNKNGTYLPRNPVLKRLAD